MLQRLAGMMKAWSDRSSCGLRDHLYGPPFKIEGSKSHLTPSGLYRYFVEGSCLDLEKGRAGRKEGYREGWGEGTHRRKGQQRKGDDGMLKEGNVKRG
jgi:hypothetical protein